MQDILYSKSRRAGGRITVSGFKPDGDPIKVPGIDQIEPGEGGFIATHYDGTTFRLLPDLGKATA